MYQTDTDDHNVYLLYMIMYLCLYFILYVCMYVRLITNSISLFVSGAILGVDWLSGFRNKKV